MFNSKINVFFPNVKIPDGVQNITHDLDLDLSLHCIDTQMFVHIKVLIWSVFVVYLGYLSLVHTSLPLSRYQNTWQTWFRPMNVDKSVSNQTYTPIINKQA